MVRNFLNGKELYKTINADEAVAFRACFPCSNID